jgi:RNAse (barnase) inhibitor barstar
MDYIIFSDEPDVLKIEGKSIDFSEIKNPKQLFDFIDKSMQLPEYFGFNWDALDECLADLYWSKEKKFVLIHRTIPFKDNIESIRLYVDTIKYANKYLNEHNEGKIVLILPLGAKILFESSTNTTKSSGMA